MLNISTLVMNINVEPLMNGIHRLNSCTKNDTCRHTIVAHEYSWCDYCVSYQLRRNYVQLLKEDIPARVHVKQLHKTNSYAAVLNVQRVLLKIVTLYSLLDILLPVFLGVQT